MSGTSQQRFCMTTTSWQMRKFIIMKNIIFLLFVLIGFTQASCQLNRPDYSDIPAFTDSVFINVVVEIPAGTNTKLEYDYERQAFLPDTTGDGEKRIISFLPYPGNYGFIPSTYMDPARGGDGDALDVLLLSESVPTGTVEKAIPVAALLLVDGGEVDIKVIAVPADFEKQIIPLEDYAQLAVQYSGIHKMLEDWFLQYKGPGVIEFQGWRDERFARDLIRKWERPLNNRR
jgi:inorganic pyrophosphatase